MIFMRKLTKKIVFFTITCKFQKPFLLFITQIKNARIGIATEIGRQYFRFSKILKDLDMNYDSILPNQIQNYDGDLVFTTQNEAPEYSSIPLLFEDITTKQLAVVKGMIIQKLDSGLNEKTLLLGIDPGQRIGISVYYLGNQISNTFFISIEKLVEYLVTIMAELNAKKKIVKIGNGDMIIANKILELLNLKFCSNFEIEFVDESNTTLKIKNYNQRGKRDMLSAQFITQRNGYWHSVLPLSLTG